MFKRTDTKRIKIGNIYLGHQNKVLIQSMCDIKTSEVDKVVEQINDCQRLGADIMRVSILDNDDAEAIKEIKKRTNIPLVGDFHFNSVLVEKTILNGIDKIRINPINTPKDQLLRVINLCKKHNVSIRIGLNEGSTTHDNKNINTIKGLIDLCLETIHFFEENDFFDICISIKSSDPVKTVKIYKKLSQITDYPLHIGVTESGFDDIGIIRSTIALSELLKNGIGDTMRVSLTKNPQLEILSAKRMLHELGLYDNYPTIISCPTCGRTKVKNLDKIAQKITQFLEENNINIKIAIMGCIINGIGEGRHADIGIAGENGQFIIFKKGKILKEIKEDKIIDALKEVISSF